MKKYYTNLAGDLSITFCHRSKELGDPCFPFFHQLAEDIDLTEFVFMLRSLRCNEQVIIFNQYEFDAIKSYIERQESSITEPTTRSKFLTSIAALEQMLVMHTSNRTAFISSSGVDWTINLMMRHDNWCEIFPVLMAVYSNNSKDFSNRKQFVFKKLYQEYYSNQMNPILLEILSLEYFLLPNDVLIFDILGDNLSHSDATIRKRCIESIGLAGLHSSGLIDPAEVEDVQSDSAEPTCGESTDEEGDSRPKDIRREIDDYLNRRKFGDIHLLGDLTIKITHLEVLKNCITDTDVVIARAAVDAIHQICIHNNQAVNWFLTGHLTDREKLKHTHFTNPHDSDEDTDFGGSFDSSKEEKSRSVAIIEKQAIENGIITQLILLLGKQDILLVTSALRLAIFIHDRCSALHINQDWLEKLSIAEMSAYVVAQSDDTEKEEILSILKSTWNYLDKGLFKDHQELLALIQSHQGGQGLLRMPLDCRLKPIEYSIYRLSKVYRTFSDVVNLVNAVRMPNSEEDEEHDSQLIEGAIISYFQYLLQDESHLVQFFKGDDLIELLYLLMDDDLNNGGFAYQCWEIFYPFLLLLLNFNFQGDLKFLQGEKRLSIAHDESCCRTKFKIFYVLPVKSWEVIREDLVIKLSEGNFYTTILSLIALAKLDTYQSLMKKSAKVIGSQGYSNTSDDDSCSDYSDDDSCSDSSVMAAIQAAGDRSVTLSSLLDDWGVSAGGGGQKQPSQIKEPEPVVMMTYPEKITVDADDSVLQVLMTIITQSSRTISNLAVEALYAICYNSEVARVWCVKNDIFSQLAEAIKPDSFIMALNLYKLVTLFPSIYENGCHLSLVLDLITHLIENIKYIDKIRLIDCLNKVSMLNDNSLLRNQKYLEAWQKVFISTDDLYIKYCILDHMLHVIGNKHDVFQIMDDDHLWQIYFYALADTQLLNKITSAYSKPIALAKQIQDFPDPLKRHFSKYVNILLDMFTLVKADIDGRNAFLISIVESLMAISVKNIDAASDMVKDPYLPIMNQLILIADNILQEKLLALYCCLLEYNTDVCDAFLKNKVIATLIEVKDGASLLFHVYLLKICNSLAENSLSSFLDNIEGLDLIALLELRFEFPGSMEIKREAFLLALYLSSYKNKVPATVTKHYQKEIYRSNIFNEMLDFIQNDQAIFVFLNYSIDGNQQEEGNLQYDCLTSIVKSVFSLLAIFIELPDVAFTLEDALFQRLMLALQNNDDGIVLVGLHLLLVMTKQQPEIKWMRFQQELSFTFQNLICHKNNIIYMKAKEIFDFLVGKGLEIAVSDQIEESHDPSGLDPMLDARLISKEQLIGQGANAKIYRGLWQDQSVAIKESKQYPNQTAVDALIYHEARILQRMRHPNIVNYFGVVLSEKPLLVMESCQQSLHQYLYESKAPPNRAERVTIVQQIILAVRYFQRQNIIHRDLNPKNVMLTTDKQIKLIDFGLARYQENPLLPMYSSSKVGTIGFSAPELMKRPIYSKSCDIWSLGMIMFAILAEQDHPPKITNDTELLDMSIILILSGYRPTLPENLSAQSKVLINSCWHAQPSRRPVIDNVHSSFQELVESTGVYLLNMS